MTLDTVRKTLPIGLLFMMQHTRGLCRYDARRAWHWGFSAVNVSLTSAVARA